MLSVSIITPCVHSGQFLPRAQESVLEQGVECVQHIVVDGRTRPGKAELLSPEQIAPGLVVRPCRSLAQAVNRGLAHASGDIIGWLAADDVYYPGALRGVMEFFHEHPGVDVVYGHGTDIDEHEQVVRVHRAAAWSASRLRRRCFLWPPAVFYRREALQRCGLLNEHLRYWSDYEYWLRLSDMGVRFSRVPRILGGSRLHAGRGEPGPQARHEADWAIEEAIRLLLVRYGRVPSSWLLRHARALVARQGYSRRDGLHFDRSVITCALRSERLCRGRSHWPVPAALRLIGRHAVGELLRLRHSAYRRERLACRGPFGLRHHAPRPVVIPAAYYHCRAEENAPLISVVTPNFGRADFIEQTIQSVLQQGYPRLQYIIQDGGSTDGSVDIIRRYEQHLAHWESRPDQGQAHAINLGMRHAQGDIMACLNSDDLLLPGALLYAARYFARHPRVDVIYGHRILVDEAGDEIGRWVLPPHNDQVLSWADYIPQETMFWRRRAWETAGGQIDESFQFAMDWDLILRFRQAGSRFARVPRFLGAFRVTDAQKTSSLIETVGQREMDRLRQRTLGRIPSAREIHQVLKPYYLWHQFYDRLYRLGVARY